MIRLDQLLTTTRKSQQIGSDIFRDAMNTQSPLEHSYILNNTTTACNENSVDTNKIKVLKVQRAGANLSNSM
jgi:hypothetical protein